MADLPFALAAVAAWWALARRRRVLAAICLGALVASKVPGAVLACLLAAGWAYGLWRAGEPRRGEMLRGLAAAGAGIVAGGVVTVAFNLLTTGTVWFGYDHSWLDGPVFGLRHLKTCGFLHLLSLLLCPPLLIVGAWSFWKRRDLGPVFAVFGFGAMMATYFFVDTAPSWAESLVLSQRLILPVVAFLLVGYADLLASLARRVRVGSAIAPVVLILLALGVSLVVSASHLRWQKPMAQALEVARATASAVGSDELALTYEASKVGLLYPGPLRAFAPGITKPPLVFCGMASASYRRPDLKAVCEFPGYRTVKTINGFAILALRPTTGFGSKNGAGAASR
ncbi:MAG: hypothetical protein JXP73_19675 [Deltaproteobacteria bacterium]|nr:hypothetical protein [Deltaproteobacteria bacterium]